MDRAERDLQLIFLLTDKMQQQLLLQSLNESIKQQLTLQSLLQTPY